MVWQGHHRRTYQLVLGLLIATGLIIAALYWLGAGPFSQHLGFYQFEVIVGWLQVHDAPNGNVIAHLQKGRRFTPDLTRQSVIDGLLWIKHDGGYSALHKLDGSEIYVDVVIASPEQSIGMAKAADLN